MATEVAGMGGSAKTATVTVAVVARRAASRVILLARLAELGVMERAVDPSWLQAAEVEVSTARSEQAAASIFLLLLGGGGISELCVL